MNFKNCCVMIAAIVEAIPLSSHARAASTRSESVSTMRMDDLPH